MTRIVVGVDGSDASKDALRWAVEEGRLRSAPVVAVHAWLVPVPPVDVTPVPHVDLVGAVARFAEAAARLIGSAVAEVVGGDTTVDVEPVAVEAPPESALLEAARGAALLVVGSRGDGGVGALLLGSVSEHVAHHAPCPVVIHRRA
jgi:nucleotide-binding universal stress UspA family protein